MKQVLQDLKSGAVVVAEVPEPAPSPGRLLVNVQASLLSAGTEAAQVAKGQQSLLSRVRQKPELLRQGLEEFRERGLAGVQRRLAGKLEGYGELGYSCAGAVIHSGDERANVLPGSLVACAGFGFANHAEVVSVPLLLAAGVPDGVSAEAAAYTTVGAVAMQGVRQARVQLGEYIAVIGLGLVGLLTAQLLRAMGCGVVGIDPSPTARKHGMSSGADLTASPEEAVEAALAVSSGHGVDAVLICAATRDSAPVALAGKIARSRGRVVMVGLTGMEIPRDDYYSKELSFTLSRAYGPGRYDRSYEEDGIDYPIDYVRFTVQRNMRAFLELLQKGRIDISPLTTHRFDLEAAPEAYSLLNQPNSDRVGVLLKYQARREAAPRAPVAVMSEPRIRSGAVGVGFIGAGAYAQGVLLPLLKQRRDVALRSVMTRSGSHALHVSQRFGFEQVSTATAEVLKNDAVEVVFIATRHDSHAPLVCDALNSGKHVWVEKPLALSIEDLRRVWLALQANPSRKLAVGFNRPFSPDAMWVRQRLSAYGPKMMLYRINAGQVPANSWVNDPATGGGRLLGEGCHFFDFVRFIAGSYAETVYTEAAGGNNSSLESNANFASTVRFADGGVAQVLYSAQGAAGLGKEYFECFSGNSCGLLDDFRSAEFYQNARCERLSKHTQDKGQAGILDAWLKCIAENSAAPVSPQDLLESSLLTLAAQRSLLERQPVAIAELRKLIA